MRPAAGTALLGLTLVLSAALFDAEPLYVPGVAFVLLAACASLWVAACARSVTISRTVGGRRALEEEAVPVEIAVASASLALPSGVVEDPLLPSPAPLAVGRRETRLRIAVRFSRRGPKRLEPPRVVVRDPFGLATRVVRHEQAAEVLVLPRIEPVLASPEGAGSGVAARRRGRPLIGGEIELDGLRPYRDGAPASRIFWPALARRGELLERRMSPDTDTRPLIVLDPSAPAREEDLDAAVRATASLCVHLARNGGCAVLLPGDRRPSVLGATLSGWPRLHARLALVQAGLPPSLAGMASRRGPLLYVAARPLGRAPRLLAHAPGGGRLLVVPGSLPGRRPAFVVAGCNGYELSSARAHAEVA
jgi:uncharacterized protein (DUF58 family)